MSANNPISYKWTKKMNPLKPSERQEPSSLAPATCYAAASKPAKPYYTGNWSKSCDNCKHAEPHYCLLYSRPMKNMDVKRCREWAERHNDELKNAAPKALDCKEDAH